LPSESQPPRHPPAWASRAATLAATTVDHPSYPSPLPLLEEAVGSPARFPRTATMGSSPCIREPFRTSPSAGRSSGLVPGSSASAAGYLPPTHAPAWGVVGTSGLRSRLCAGKLVLAERATAARRASARQRARAPPSAHCRLLPRQTCYGDIMYGC